MQLQITANALTLNTNESLNTAGRNQPAVSGTVLPSSLSSSEVLQASPVTKPVPPSGAGASIDPYTEEQQLSRDQRSESRKSSETDPQSEEQQLIRELAARDQEVRQHELSHAAAGGQYAGAPSFEYERGPDGRLYAVGGEVSIDTSPIPNDPEATLEKAEVILRAALAVADPSPQDRAIAARAAAMASEARAELAQQNQESQENAGTQREADQLRESRRTEELQNRIKDQQEQSDSQSEKLQDFNRQLEAVNEQFAEINQKLIDAGVFKKLFAEGFIFDETV
ncbi:putative metalloprotease CJM1_0395 family protein [Amphritea japonica]|uniref:SrpA-related protein n=1 Tax=Amphritea japonica ATCC BAA-1530 TaxID=1278309 RepID=A0A7R6SS85_9GAMM|nr:putative metalloprotease CJM1_0395 family protein [Amphritea japonica]BBB25337.1 hypothetical protein AMJAP_0738 [Amphritea japonica ATCC BAA-1530]